jgi:hypothetical protein
MHCKLAKAEAEACVAGTKGAAALGYHKVICESDCQTLVYTLKSSSHELSEIGILLREVRRNCVGQFKNFENYEFMFCPQNCNQVL